MTDPRRRAFARAASLGAFVGSVSHEADLEDLAGFCVVKDNIDVSGLPSLLGLTGFEPSRATEDAEVVSRLRQAGYQMAAKTTMHPLGYGYSNLKDDGSGPRNPIAPDRIAGGSSGGSALAVALGAADIALGTDTCGSVRIPAAFCGVFGFRPTSTRYPMHGVFGTSPSRDTVGIIAGSMADLQCGDRVVAADCRDRPDVPKITLGVPLSGYDLGQSAVAETFDHALSSLHRSGVEIKRIPLDRLVASAQSIGRDIMVVEAGAALRRFLTSHGLSLATLKDMIGEKAAAGLVTGQIVAAVDGEEDVRSLQATTMQLRGSLRQIFEAEGLDAILAPTAPILPPFLAEAQADPHALLACLSRNATLASVAGMPSLSVPYRGPDASMPIGLQLESLPGNDLDLFCLAEEIVRIIAPETPSPGDRFSAIRSQRRASSARL